MYSHITQNSLLIRSITLFKIYNMMDYVDMLFVKMSSKAVIPTEH